MQSLACHLPIDYTLNATIPRTFIKCLTWPHKELRRDINNADKDDDGAWTSMVLLTAATERYV